MKKIYLLLFVFLIGKISYSQSFAWVNTAGNSTFVDYGFGVAVDHNHNVIATGMHFDIGTFGSTTVNPYGIQDAYIAKYDSTGNLLWVHGIGGGEQDWGYAVAVDASNNIFVTGTYAWYAIHFTATDSLPISATSATNSFIAKYDANGNFLWAHSGGSSYSKSSSVTTDASGNTIISGFYNSSINFSGTTLTGGGSNLFFVKYSPTGSLIWAISGNSNANCSTNALKCDASGNIYATGKISLPVTFPSGSFSNIGGDDMYTAKFDASGSVQWFKVEGKSQLASTTGNNFDCGNGLDIDNSGNVYVAGSLLDTAISTSYYQSMAIVKYNNSGVKQWLHQYGNNGVDVCNSLSLDAAGNPFIIGNYQGTVTLDSKILPTAIDADIFIAKFNASGNCVSALGIGTGNGDDSGNGIFVDKTTSSIYTTGAMRNSLNFGSIPVAGDNASTIFIAKMNSGTLNGINELNKGTNFTVYPNPSNGIINIQFETAAEYTVEVCNATGQVIFMKKIKELNDQVDLSTIANGFYSISITDNNGNRTAKKLIKQ